MISKEDIEHLKDLARVEFGKEETEKLASNLAAILEHIGSLKEADVSGISGKEFASVGLKNVVRPDIEGNSDINAGELIGAFPEKHEDTNSRRHDADGSGTYLKVRSIL